MITMGWSDGLPWGMASWDDVRGAVSALPEATEAPGRDGLAVWSVRGKGFVWERPLRRSDLAALGDAAPAGPVLAAYVQTLEAKDELIAADPETFFTTPHFTGFRAVLVRLDRIEADRLSELVLEAWIARASKRLAKAYLDTLG